MSGTMWLITMLIPAMLGIYIFAVWRRVRIPPLKVSPESEISEIVSETDAWLTKLKAEHKFSGVTLVIRDGKELIAGAYGFADAGRRTSLTVSSPMRIASVSKQFTAAAILLLVSQNKLDLDAPIDVYLNEFPYKGIKVRHVLSQTSGIPDSYMKLWGKKKTEKTLTIQAVVALISDSGQDTSFNPGERFAYSNTNFVLLAAIVERISGLSFEDFMQLNIFKPLGMKESRVWNLLSKKPALDGQTKTYNMYAKRKRARDLKMTNLDGVAGDGAIFTSVRDIGIWNQFWTSGRGLVPPEILQLAFEAGEENKSPEVSYGFGWVLEDNASWHNGMWLGANAYLWRSNNGKDVLFLADNGSNVCFDKIVEELKQTFFADASP